MAALRHDGLILPTLLQQQLISEALAAFPRECCGLIEGIRRDGAIEAVGLHATRNLAARADRFEIDPMEQFRLMRALRDTEREIVGCYHSHPNGIAKPSAYDLACAADENIVWLIAGVGDGKIADIAAYLFADGQFHPVRLTP